MTDRYIFHFVFDNSTYRFTSTIKRITLGHVGSSSSNRLVESMIQLGLAKEAVQPRLQRETLSQEPARSDLLVPFRPPRNNFSTPTSSYQPSSYRLRLKKISQKTARCTEWQHPPFPTARRPNRDGDYHSTLQVRDPLPSKVNQSMKEFHRGMTVRIPRHYHATLQVRDPLPSKVNQSKKKFHRGMIVRIPRRPKETLRVTDMRAR